MSKKDKSTDSQDVTVSSEENRKPATFDRQIEDLFEDFFNRRWPRFSDLSNVRWPKLEFPAGKSVGTKMPSMDVVDREKEVLVRVELPGISKEDIDVSVSGNSITVQGTTRKETESDKDQYHHKEIVSSYVSRTLPLPCEVDGDSAVAKMDNGMLEVTIPKVESAKRKKVEIS